MAPKVTEEHLEARREQILGAAIACFAEKGFHKTSMKDICNKSQLSPGAVYHYFESKDDIVEAVCRLGEEQNGALFEQTRKLGGSMREQVEFNLGGYRQMLKDPLAETYLKADIMFHAEVLTNERLRESGKRNYETILGHLQQVVESWQREGHANKALDPRATAQVLFATVNGIGFQKLIDPDMDLDKYFQSLSAIIMGDLTRLKDGAG